MCDNLIISDQTKEDEVMVSNLLNSTDTEVPNPVLDGVIVALTIRFLYCQVIIYQFDKHANYIQGTDITRINGPV